MKIVLRISQSAGPNDPRRNVQSQVLEVAAEICAADFVDRRHEQVAGKTDGPEGFAQFVKSIRSALPDLSAARR
jgi:hypothetical protein